MTGRKLAIFDIDGTIAIKGKIPPEVLKGLMRMQDNGFLTTISTGRGYVRAKEVLGDSFTEIISADSFMIVEHGAKIVDRDGNVIRADYFKENELDHVTDFCKVNKDMVRLMWFMSPDISVPVQVWCKYPEDIPSETEKRGHYAELFSCSFEELRERLNAFLISSISVKLEPFILVENLKLHFTRSELDVVFQDGMMEFLRNIADKGKAIQFLESHFKVQVADMLLAGNAINDVDMLNLEAGKRVLVGEGPTTEVVLGHLKNIDQVVRVSSPQELGAYLQTIT